MDYQDHKGGYSDAIRHYTILEIAYMIHTLKKIFHDNQMAVTALKVGVHQLHF